MVKLITVFGATGGQGGGVADALLSDPEFKVRAVTRNVSSEKAKKLQARGAEVVSANIDDPASLRAAFEGAYGCFVVTNFWDHMDADKEIQQGKNAVDAAKAAGIRHFVYSGLESVQKLLGIPCPHFDTKAQVVEYLQQSNLPFTSVRFSFYFDNLATILPPYKVSENNFVLNFPMGRVAMDGVNVHDGGEIVHQILRNGVQYMGKFVGISGDKLTVEEYAAVLSKHLAPKKFSDGQMTVDQFSKLGFPGADDLANMFAFYQRGNPVRDLSLSRKLNPKMQTFEQWVIKNKDKLEAVTS